MEISQNGLSLIEQFEGLVLHVYLDIANFPTVGYGHKLLNGESYPNGITQTQAQVLLNQDVQKVVDFINGLNLPLNQNEFDALCDFGYNLGVGSLQTMLHHGIDQIPNQILLWDHSGGVVNDGLLRRRQAELALWNTQ